MLAFIVFSLYHLSVKLIILATKLVKVPGSLIMLSVTPGVLWSLDTFSLSRLYATTEQKALEFSKCAHVVCAFVPLLMPHWAWNACHTLICFVLKTVGGGLRTSIKNSCDHGLSYYSFTCTPKCPLLNTAELEVSFPVIFMVPFNGCLAQLHHSA